MLHTDKALLALLLLRIYLKCGTNEVGYDTQFDHLLLRFDLLVGESSKAMQDAARKLNVPPLGQAQLFSLLNLARLPTFKDCVNKVEAIGDLTDWYMSDKPEVNVPVLWNEDENLSMLSTFMHG